MKKYASTILFRLAAAFSFALALSGCGQTGALYLPEKATLSQVGTPSSFSNHNRLTLS